MKALALALAGCIALSASSFAGMSMGKQYKDYKQVEPTCFEDNEWQLDTFGTYKAAEQGNYFDDGWGGGVALNYFFHRYIGFGIEGHWDGTGPDDVAIHHANGMLIFRYPIDHLCLAPYAFGGGGGSWDGDGRAAGFVGGGLEYRVLPHRVGLFGDGRYTWTEDAANYGLFRLGVRLVF